MDRYYNRSAIDFPYYAWIVASALKNSYVAIIASAIIMLALSFLVTKTLPEEYEATAVLQATPEQESMVDFGNRYASRRDPAFLQTQIDIMRSRKLINQVVEKTGLDQPGALVERQSLLSGISDSIRSIFVDRKEPTKADRVRDAAENVLRSLEIRARRNSYLIDIEFTSTDPNFAMLIPNTLADLFVESMIQEKKNDASRSEEWLRERLRSVQSELAKSVQALQLFKESEKIIGSSQQNSGIASQELELVSGRLMQVRETRLGLESAYQQIQQVEAAEGDLHGLAVVQSSNAIQSIRNTILQLEQRKSELSKRYGPEHRQMIGLESEIESAYEKLNVQTQRVVSALKAEYELARENEKFFETLLQDSTANVQILGRKAFELLNLEQEVATQRQVYEAFLRKLSQSEATGDTLDITVRLTDSALPPRAPVHNKHNNIMLVTVLATIFLGLTTAILRELFDNTVISSSDAVKKLGRPVLGTLPLISEEAVDEDVPDIAYQFYSNNKSSPYAENIRSIRASLLLSSLSHKRRRYLLTSTDPGEGKTSASISIATAFGQIKRTLLIDGDLRRPSINHLLPGDVTRHLGLSDLLIGASDNECIVNLEPLGIDVLPAGTISPNPQEIFCSMEFGQLLNRLSEEYECIIIDSPPCAGLSDSLLLASHVDQIIFMVKAAETIVPKIRATLQKLNESSTPIAGIVLNQTKSSAEHYGYNKYYHVYESDQTSNAAS